MIKRSPIWKMPIDEFRQLVSRCSTFKSILDAFGFNYSNMATLKRRLELEKVDYSHIPHGRYASRGRNNWIKPPIPFEKLFTINSIYAMRMRKRYIWRNKVIPYACAQCNLGPEWNHKPLVLILDHKNGIRNDNRLVNLQFVCPNCDHQSSTFGSKNGAKRHCCSECGVKITNKSVRCVKCSNRDRVGVRRVLRPNKNELLKMVWEIPTSKIAVQYGVSDKAVAKWCKSYNIVKPGPGYWAKLQRTN